MDIKKIEEAVSPVVGVMLMLVVTIIIAAVVSSFSGSLANSNDAALKVSINVNLNEECMAFEHLGGDPVPTKDLRIITYYTYPGGRMEKHEQVVNSPLVALDKGLEDKDARVPVLTDVTKVGKPGNNPDADFGNYTWITGDVLSTYSPEGTSSLLGFDIEDTANGFGEGSVVDVKIIHIPSQKYIFDREVICT